MCSVCLWGELLTWDKESSFSTDGDVSFLDELLFIGLEVLSTSSEEEFLLFGSEDLLAFLLDCMFFVSEEELSVFGFEVSLAFSEGLVSLRLVESSFSVEELTSSLGLGVVLGVVSAEDESAIWAAEDLATDADGKLGFSSN